MRTAAVEFVAKQPSAPFVGTVDQFAGYEDIWREAGSGAHSFLTYKIDPKAPGPPTRSMPPSGATGLDQQAVIAANDIEAVIGIYKESLGAQSNANSGRAILARQREGDTGTFFFVDNLRTALTFGSKVLLDLIPKIYDTPRVVRTLSEDGSHNMVQINQAPPPGMEMEDLPIEVRHALNDLSIGEYDVIVSTGPGYASKRQESSEAMTTFMQAFPAAAPVIGDLVAKAQDWPGSEEISERLKAVNPLFRPQPQPDPKVQAGALKDTASAKLIEAQAEGQLIENLGSGVAVMQAIAGLHASIQQLQQSVAQMGQLPQAGAGPAPAPAPPSSGAAPAPNGGMVELEPLQPPQPSGTDMPNGGQTA
jgi:hypothetical protein